jgi:hypothetical protein
MQNPCGTPKYDKPLRDTGYVKERSNLQKYEEEAKNAVWQSQYGPKTAGEAKPTKRETP